MEPYLIVICDKEKSMDHLMLQLGKKDHTMSKKGTKYYIINQTLFSVHFPEKHIQGQIS